MIQSIEQAKIAIINYNTLPSQIDHVAPFKRMKNEAEAFLDLLPREERDQIWVDITESIDAYYAEDEGGISAAYLDSLF